MAINVLYQHKALANPQTLGINQSFLIDTATVVNGNAVYRKVLFLRLPADVNATQLVLKQFQLTAAFSAATFTVNSASSFLKPQGWKQKDGKTVIRFQRAWPISRVNSNSHNGFAFYRVDGDAIVDEATTSGSSNRDLGPGFVSHEFAVGLTMFETLEREILITAQHGASNRVVQKKSLSSASSSLTAREADIVEVANNLEHTATVNYVGLRSIGIFGMPTTPRVGILQDALIGAAVEAGNYAAGKIDWLSLTAGEHASGINAVVDADVLPRLQAIVDARRAAEPGAVITVPLVFESDAPCICRLTQLQVNHALRNTLFGDAQTETKLRFSGTAVDGQPLALTLPRGVIESVSVAINDAAQDQLAVGVSADAAQRKSVNGAAVNIQQAVAARVSLPAATVVRGVSIAVNALLAGTSIEVALIEDRNGTPSGGLLASAALPLERVGTRQFVNVLFDTAAPLLLDQKPYWLLLRATAGSLLWLAAPAASASKVLLLKNLQSSAAVSGVTQAARAIPGIALEYGWIHNRNGSNPIDAVFSIGRQPVPLTSDALATDRYRLQLPASLAQPLADTPVLLTITRTSAGIVSLSGLQIDYLPHG